MLRQRAGERQVGVPADDAGHPASGNPSAVYGRLSRRPMPSARVRYVPDAAGLEELVVNGKYPILKHVEGRNSAKACRISTSPWRENARASLDE